MNIKSDPQLEKLINLEEKRQSETWSLIASENEMFDEVREILGSKLNNKYSEGYAGKRYYNGNQFIDEIENLAISRTCEGFGANFANVQSYSGSPANQAIYKALLNPGDTVLGFDLNCGGHLTHGASVNFSGSYYNSITYKVDPQTELIDFEEVRKLAYEYKPKLIICGTTAYSREIDFQKFKEIATEVGAFLLADISHISGLIISNLHPSPVGIADVMMSTTHKQLRGPRGAVILSNSEEIMTKINKAVFPGLQGGPHNSTTAAIALCMKKVNSREYKDYCKRIVENRKVMQDVFVDNEIQVVSGGSDNHLLVLKVGTGRGRQVADELEKLGIIINANTIPFDPSSPFKPSGIRIGTPWITSRNIDSEKLTELTTKIVEIVKSTNI
ncbi:serine hydroxymethyltransferase [bacterium]|nr:MAG: serine hydroxymethyltransferase [bacterium]